MYRGCLEKSTFEGMDCVPVMLVGFLGVLGGMVVCAILVGGCTIFFSGGRIYFAQYYICRMLQNRGNCMICSVRELLWRYFAAIKLCD